MSYTFIIIAIVIFVAAAWITYTVRRMKNTPTVADSSKIKILSNKNFKNHIRSGTVLVDFWAPWCMPCKMMAPVLNDLAEDSTTGATIAKVNVDEQQQLAQKYKIRSIPTMVVFVDGKEARRISGVKSKGQLLKELKAV